MMGYEVIPIHVSLIADKRIGVHDNLPCFNSDGYTGGYTKT